MQVIITNDDLGLNKAFNRGIVAAYTRGVTTNTSIRVNGTAYAEAKRLLKGELAGIGLGLHLNLTDGSGYRRNFLDWAVALKTNPSLLTEVEKDLVRQFEKAIVKDKLAIDHVSGHDHIHMLSPIFAVVARLTKEYGIRHIRITREDFYFTGKLMTDLAPFVNGNLVKHLWLKRLAQKNISITKSLKLTFPEAFFGTLHTNGMSLAAIKAALIQAQKEKYTCVEILSHPAIVRGKEAFTSPFIKKYTFERTRLQELEVLTSQALKNFIEQEKIKLTNFHKLKR